MTTERRVLPTGTTPPGWPTPARMAAIIDAIKRRVEEYRAEFEERDDPEKGQPS